MENIRNSEKGPLIMRVKEAMNDVRSVIGSHLRNIMLLVGKTSVEGKKVEDVETLEYLTGRMWAFENLSDPRNN